MDRTCRIHTYSMVLYVVERKQDFIGSRTKNTGEDKTHSVCTYKTLLHYQFHCLNREQKRGLIFSHEMDVINSINSSLLRTKSELCIPTTMTNHARNAKRHRTDSSIPAKKDVTDDDDDDDAAADDHNTTGLSDLVQHKDWEKVVSYCRKNPSAVLKAPDPSPLAIACRIGAPIEVIQILLDVGPTKVRHVLDSRGTPLHEAILCEHTTMSVFDALLKTDQDLGTDTPRATLLQDVDGYTPLHHLIRRRFQSHILRSQETVHNDTHNNERNTIPPFMELLERLVQSCPEAVAIPDRGEYEEPPIVYALKANIYAPSLGSAEEMLAQVERQIYEMVRTMLKHAPFAAAQVFSGFRGQYSALHSAVFHGRYATTIDLLLKTEAEYPAKQKAALLTNTQSELPLHFWYVCVCVYVCMR